MKKKRALTTRLKRTNTSTEQVPEPNKRESPFARGILAKYRPVNSSFFFVCVFTYVTRAAVALFVSMRMPGAPTLQQLRLVVHVRSLTFHVRDSLVYAKE